MDGRQAKPSFPHPANLSPDEGWRWAPWTSTQVANSPSYPLRVLGQGNLARAVYWGNSPTPALIIRTPALLTVRGWPGHRAPVDQL